MRYIIAALALSGAAVANAGGLQNTISFGGGSAVGVDNRFSNRFLLEDRGKHGMDGDAEGPAPEGMPRKPSAGEHAQGPMPEGKPMREKNGEDKENAKTPMPQGKPMGEKRTQEQEDGDKGMRGDDDSHDWHGGDRGPMEELDSLFPGGMYGEYGMDGSYGEYGMHGRSGSSDEMRKEREERRSRRGEREPRKGSMMGGEDPAEGPAPMHGEHEDGQGNKPEGTSPKGDEGEKEDGMPPKPAGGEHGEGPMPEGPMRAAKPMGENNGENKEQAEGLMPMGRPKEEEKPQEMPEVDEDLDAEHSGHAEHTA